MSLAVFRVIGIVLFLYLSWRNLRDNYKDEDLVTYGWASILAFLVGSRIVFGLKNWGVWNESWLNWLLVWQYPGSDFLGGYLSMLGLSFWLTKVYGWKVWQFLEDMTGVTLIFFSFIFFDELVRTRINLEAFSLLVISLAGTLFYYFIRGRYRSFVWYKSGKKGFAFFATNAMVMSLFSLRSSLLLGDVVGVSIFVSLCLISIAGLVILGEVFDQLLVSAKRRNK